jgi:hypothetical protein
VEFGCHGVAGAIGLFLEGCPDSEGTKEKETAPKHTAAVPVAAVVVAAVVASGEGEDMGI